MSFILPEYRAPDFSQARFQTVPDAILRPAPRDGVAPEGYHATTIFPEYFKIGGRWLLAVWTVWRCFGAGRWQRWNSAT